MSVQLENGYTKIANEMIDAFCKFRIRGESWQVLMAIFRKTYGYNKKEDWIAHTQIVEMTGLDKGNASRELSKLITQNIVVKSDNKLRLNKNYKEWKQVVKSDNKKLSKVTTPVVNIDTTVVKSDGNKRQYTKDNTTKEIIPNGIREFGNSQINECRDYFLKVFQLPKEDGSVKWNRIYWSNLIKASKTGVAGVKWLIDQAHDDNFLRPNITSARALSSKQVLIISRKREGVSYGTRHNVDARGIE